MCLHTFPLWNKINNEKKNSTYFFKIKHCLFILWMGEFSPFNIGSVGIPQWLEHQIRDQKVPSSSPRRSGFFFLFFLQSLRINSCWFLSVFTAAHARTHTHRVRLTDSDVCSPSHKDTNKHTDVCRHMHTHTNTCTSYTCTDTELWVLKE